MYVCIIFLSIYLSLFSFSLSFSVWVCLTYLYHELPFVYWQILYESVFGWVQSIPPDWEDSPGPGNDKKVKKLYIFYLSKKRKWRSEKKNGIGSCGTTVFIFGGEYFLSESPDTENN